MSRENGFTLIELMIVVAIIGILSIVAFPAYLDYMRTAANNACLGEVKGYTMSVLVAVTDGAAAIPSPSEKACNRITDATAIANLSFNSIIEAYPVAPGDVGTRCNLNASTSCVLDANVTP